MAFMGSCAVMLSLKTCGSLCYLLFTLRHPSPDGSGRMVRAGRVGPVSVAITMIGLISSGLRHHRLTADSIMAENHYIQGQNENCKSTLEF